MPFLFERGQECSRSMSDKLQFVGFFSNQQTEVYRTTKLEFSNDQQTEVYWTFL